MGLPNKNSSVDIKDQIESAKKIADAIKGTTAPLQNLAAIVKGIQLKLIDPKDQQRLQQFVEVVSKTGFSNWSELNKVLKLSLGDLQKYRKEVDDINKLNEKQLKNDIERDDIAEEAYKRFKKEKKDKEEYFQLTDKLKNLEEQITVEMLKRLPVLDTFNSKVDELSNIQKTVLNNNTILNKSYQEISSNATAGLTALLEQMANAQVPNVIADSLQFPKEIVEGMLDEIDAVIEHMTTNFNSIDVGATVSRLTKSGELASEVLKTSFDQIIQGIASQAQIAPQLAEKIVEDLKNKLAGVESPQIFTPEEAAEVESLFQQAAAAGNTQLQSLVLLAAQAADAQEVLNQKIAATNDNLQNVTPTLVNAVSGFSSAMTDGVNALQSRVNSFMPSWLSQTLGIQSAFSQLNSGVQAAGQQMIATITSTGSVTAGLKVAFQTLNATILANPIGLIIAAAAALLSLIIQSQNSAAALSQEFGISRREAKEINGVFREMQMESAKTLVTQKDLTSVLKQHGDMYGRTLDMNNKSNQEALKFSSMLGRQFGVSAGEVYGMGQQFEQMGADQTLAQNITAWTAKAAELNGIPFKNITKDLAESSKEVALYFRGMPKQAAKSIIQIHKLGMTLKSMGAVMDKSLSIESFIKDMTELQIMTQGSANLGKFFDMRHSGASQADLAKEIAAQYDNMVASGQANEYTIRKFAEATGMSVEELEKGHKIRQMEGKLSKEQLAIAEKYMDKIDSATLENEAALAAKIDQLTAEEKMEAAMSKISASLKTAFLPAAEMLAEVFDGIGTAVDALTPVFQVLIALVKGMVLPFKVIVNLLTLDFKGAIDSAASAFGEFNGPLSLIKWTIVAIGGAIAVAFAVNKISSWGSALMGTLKNFKQNIQSVASGIKNLFGKGADAAAATTSTTTTAVQTGADTGKKVTESTSAVANAKEPKSVGAKLKEFLTNLAAGLKKMADTKVLKGAINLIPASAGLVIMIPGAIGAKLLEKVKGSKVKAALVGIAEGLERMGTAKVLVGSLALIPASIGLAIMIPGAIGAFLLSKIDGGKLKKSMVGLAEGIERMGTGKVLLGSLALVIASLGFIAMIPGAIGLLAIAALGGPASAGLIALSTGLAALGAVVMTGAGAVGLLALVGLAIGLAYALKVAGPAIQAFAPVLMKLVDMLGNILITAIKEVSKVLGGIAAVIRAIGGVIISIGLAISDIILSIGDAITNIGNSIANIIRTIFDGISQAIESVVSAIERLASIDGASLFVAAGGIAAIGGALAMFGGGGFLAGIGSAIGEFFGGDPIEKFKAFAEIGPSLQIAGAAMATLVAALNGFGASLDAASGEKLTSVSQGLIALVESFQKVNESLAEMGPGVLESFGAMISNFAGSDSITQLQEFAAMAPAIDAAATSINNLALSLNNLSTSISTLDVDKLQEIKIPAAGLDTSKGKKDTDKKGGFFGNILGEGFTEGLKGMFGFGGKKEATPQTPLQKTNTQIAGPTSNPISNSLLTAKPAAPVIPAGVTAQTAKPVTTQLTVPEKPLAGPTATPTAAGGTTPQTSQDGSTANINTTLKQLISSFQAFANRPVVVQIGDMELRDLNRKLKVYNNRG